MADPFRALEDDDAPATRAWVDAENALTRQTLDGTPRETLVARLWALHQTERSSPPAVGGTRLFVVRNDGTRNQPVLEMLDGNNAPVVLVDPNALDPDGTTAITAVEPDTGGNRVAYALSHAGSDRQIVRVVDVHTQRDLTDQIRHVKFASIAWLADGFFYTRYPEPGTVAPEDEQYFCQVWFHRLGEPQSSDRLVYHRPDRPQVVFEVKVTSDETTLVVTSRPGATDKAEIHAFPLRDGRWNDDSPMALVTGFTDGWHFIDGRASRLFLLTDAHAPLGRIVSVNSSAIDDAGANDREFETVVPESSDRLEHAVVAGERLLVASLRNASSRLSLFELDGRAVTNVNLPGIGSVLGLAGSWHNPRAYATFTSYTMPPRVFVCDTANGSMVPARSASPSPVDPEAYHTEIAWFPSRDGTKVSMFVVRRKDLDQDLPSPVLLNGYGGFNISMTPMFDPSDFLWLDRGGTLAFAHLRGGGEYGESWHQAGMRERKQNVFDDFIGAAEWLLATGRVRRGGIAIEGGSNGGLLVGAALIQRPDLFGAVICRVPVADMLRYHLFTVGRFWIPEYGCADDPTDFPFLLKYSPYHQAVDGTRYPPTLVMTADTDDRVAPGMAKKFAARLQEAAAPDSGPILLRVESRAGHGAGKSRAKQIDEQADIYAFLFSVMDWSG